MKTLFVKLSVLASEAPRYMPMAMMTLTLFAFIVGMRPPEGDGSTGR